MLAKPCSDPQRFFQAFQEKRHVVAMTLLPDATQAFARRFGYAPSICHEKIQECLSSLGVADVFFSDCLWEAKRRLAAEELVRRFATEGSPPLMLNSCPRFCEGAAQQLALPEAASRADLLDAYGRSLTIRSLVSTRHGVPFTHVLQVTVVGCAAQRESYRLRHRDGLTPMGEEYVLTIRELLLWLTQAGALPPGGEQSAVSSRPRGMLLAVLSQAIYQQSGVFPSSDSLPLGPKPKHSSILQGAIPFQGRVLRYAQASGLHELSWLRMHLNSDESKYHLIEVFSCACCQ